jgi:hypothetical protein
MNQRLVVKNHEKEIYEVSFAPRGSSKLRICSEALRESFRTVRSPEPVVRKNGVPYFHVDFNHYLISKLSGVSSLRVDPFAKTIKWSEFYPLINVTGGRKIGLGTLAQVDALTILQNSGIADDKFIIYHTTPSDHRKIHLRRLGISPFQAVPFREYLERSRNYCLQKGFDLTGRIPLA